MIGRRFMKRYGPLVWKTVYRILRDHTEALDCFQVVFAEVLERSPSRRVRDWPAFLRWLAMRRALDRLRNVGLTPEECGIRVRRRDFAGRLAWTRRPGEWNELLERVRDEFGTSAQAAGSGRATRR